MAAWSTWAGGGHRADGIGANHCGRGAPGGRNLPAGCLGAHPRHCCGRGSHHRQLHCRRRRLSTASRLSCLPVVRQCHYQPASGWQAERSSARLSTVGTFCCCYSHCQSKHQFCTSCISWRSQARAEQPQIVVGLSNHGQAPTGRSNDAERVRRMAPGSLRDRPTSGGDVPRCRLLGPCSALFAGSDIDLRSSLPKESQEHIWSSCMFRTST